MCSLNTVVGQIQVIVINTSSRSQDKSHISSHVVAQIPVIPAFCRVVQEVWAIYQDLFFKTQNPKTCIFLVFYFNFINLLLFYYFNYSSVAFQFLLTAQYQGSFAFLGICYSSISLYLNQCFLPHNRGSFIYGPILVLTVQNIIEMDLHTHTHPPTSTPTHTHTFSV